MNRRRVARACIAAGFLCIIGTVVLAGIPGHHVRALSFSTVASGALAIGGGLTYLRTAVSRRDMSGNDRAEWGSARTLGDLGELTARWLEGGIGLQPGYCGPSDIEDPALVPVLARLNRAGFVTTGSQPAFDGPGYEGAHWQQRAAVEGFAAAGVALPLCVAAREAGLTVIVHDPAGLPRWRYGYGKSVTVTRRAGEHHTGFGVQLPRRHIRDAHIGYGICHPGAVDALCGAWQVTVIDPEWGRNDRLWDVVAAAVCPDGRTS